MPAPASHFLEVAAPSRLHFGLLSFGIGQSSRHTPCAVTAHVGESLRDSDSRLGETRARHAAGCGTRSVPTTLADHARQFGGAGAMIDQPGLLLRFWPAERLVVEG